MPIEYSIDHKRRLVTGKARGTLTDQEVFGYQREVWSRPEVAGYDELIDMSEVEHVAVPSDERIQKLAQLSAGMDPLWSGSKFAIVAPQDFAFELGRLYAANRDVEDRGTKQVAVFRTLAEALTFLRVEGA